MLGIESENYNFDIVDELDVYKRYYRAHCVFNTVERRAALVKLTAVKNIEGMLAYRISASFFPFETEDDFAVSYDACVEKYVMFIKKRRLKTKEASLIEEMPVQLDELIRELDPEAVIYWEKPLRDAVTA